MLNKVAMIGVPMDLGGGRRGVDMGPSAIRIAGLEDGIRRLGLQYEDRGNLAVPAPESREPRDPRARFLGEISRACQRLRVKVEKVLEDGVFPLVVGGDHSIAVGVPAIVKSVPSADLAPRPPRAARAPEAIFALTEGEL